MEHLVYQKHWSTKGFHATAVDKEFADVEKGGGVRLLAADLLLPATMDMLLNVIRKRRVCCIHFGIECSSFSILRIRGAVHHDQNFCKRTRR